MFTSLLVLSVLSSSFVSDDKWTNTNTVLELGFVGSVVVDVLETRYFIGKPDLSGGCSVGHKCVLQEKNPILGTHPSALRIYSLSALAVVAHTTISYMLPSIYREIWQTVSLSVEIANDYRNYTYVGSFHLAF